MKTESSAAKLASMTTEQLHAHIIQETENLLLVETDPISVSANVASLVFTSLNAHSPNKVNWVGFYFWRPRHADVLKLGPFMGLPACYEIELRRGVCGASFTRDATILVEDVHTFPGHIACDSASNSECVVPLHDPKAEGRKIGVLDVDSPHVGGLTEQDRALLERVAMLLCDSADWSVL